MKYRLLKLRGYVRILFGFCPVCNSDAPALDDCTFCKGFRWYADEMRRAGLRAQWAEVGPVRMGIMEALK